MALYKITGTGVWDNEREIWFDAVHEKLWAEYQLWLSIPGNVPDPADPPPPAPTVYKEKNSIQLQLIAAGKMADARAILNRPGNEDNKDLWNGAYKIAYDDQAVRGMISAVGMDAEIVMSNATNWGG